MISRTSDVVVIGAGVIGCAIALELSKRAYRVVVIERADIGSGASGGNPGVISVATKPPSMVRPTLASHAALIELLDELEDGCSYNQGGSLVIYEGDEEEAYLQERADNLRQAGADVAFVAPQEARDLQPLLTDAIGGALWSPSDAVINSGQLTRALARAAVAAGALIIVGNEVTDVLMDGDRVVGVVTTEGAWHGEWVINAAGAWSSAIGSIVGDHHVVVPRRGQLVWVKAPQRNLPVRVSTARELLMKELAAQSTIGVGLTPRGDGTIALGGTNEDVGFNQEPEAVTCAAIVLQATRLFPSLAHMKVDRVWAGLRPRSPDGHPIIRTSSIRSGYVVASGHGGDGVALAAFTARYVAHLVSTERPLSPVNFGAQLWAEYSKGARA